MEIVKGINEMRKVRQGFPLEVGCVLTMGAIHTGHMSLIERSVTENPRTVCSIFVNPLQFPDGTDLRSYPSSIEADLTLMERAGVDAVFMPSQNEMYGTGLLTKITFSELSNVYEGIDRPGHFEGVGIVVSKLLNIITPQKAYFGQKDYQQTRIINALVNDMNMETEVIICDTVREPNGLAVSSRNTLLTKESRERAGCLYRALEHAAVLRASGESLRIIEEQMSLVLNADPDVDRVHYFDFVDRENLRHLHSNKKPCVLIAAITVQGIRLIDNLSID